MAGEAIVVPILIDPKAGIAGLKAFGNAAVETGAKFTTANTGSKLFGDGIKGLGKNLLAVNPLWGIGVAAIAGFITSLLSGKEASESFTKANKAAADSIAGDLVSLTSLVGLIKNVNTSQEDRIKGIKVLNSEYGKYLTNLDNEKISLENISSAYDQIVDSLLRQAVVKGAQNEIEKAVADTAAKIIDITRQQQRTEDEKRIATEKANKAASQKGALDTIGLQKIQQLNRATTDGYLATINQTSAMQKQIATLDVYGAMIDNLKNQLKKDLEPLFNITSNFSDLDIKDPKVTKSPKIKVDKVEVKPNRVIVDFNQSNTADFNKSITNLMKYMFDKDVKFDFVAPVLIPPEEARQQGLTFAQMFGREVDAYFKQAGTTDFSLINAQKNYDDAKKKAAELLAINVRMAEQITGILTPATDGFVDALLNNGDALQGFFSGLKNSIAQLIKQIISAIVQAAILNALTGGVSGGARRIGSIIGGIGRLGFAAGGLVTGPVSALVGEGAGTNRSNPEVIAPLDKLKSFFAQMNGRGAGFNNANMGIAGSMLAIPGTVQLRASGRDLAGILALEDLNKKRTG